MTDELHSSLLSLTLKYIYLLIRHLTCLCHPLLNQYFNNLKIYFFLIKTNKEINTTNSTVYLREFLCNFHISPDYNILLYWWLTKQQNRCNDHLFILYILHSFLICYIDNEWIIKWFRFKCCLLILIISRGAVQPTHSTCMLH